MLQLSDRLAIARTDLANERTLLAYLRTALAVAAGGVAVIEVFTLPVLVIFGWALIPLGLIVLAVGIVRFRRTRQVLLSLEADAQATMPHPQ